MLGPDRDRRYLACRPGELAVLRWAQVDLQRRIVTFDRAWDNKRNDGSAKRTKTRKSRDVAIDQDILPLLMAMRAERPDDEHVIGVRDRIDLHHMEPPFRVCLARAGVDRAALHEGDDMNDPAGLYTTRHTGLTWEAMRTGSAFDVRDLGGHESIATTNGYVSSVSAYKRNPEQFGTPFPPLPKCLIGTLEEAGFDHKIDHTWITSTIRCEEGDLNPHSVSTTGT